jgi:transcriptional regulator with XRE-family HTH domain
MNDFPKKLKAWRQAKKLTQTEAGKKFGVKLRQFQNWEAGVYKPRGLTLAAVLAAIK